MYKMFPWISVVRYSEGCSSSVYWVDKEYQCHKVVCNIHCGCNDCAYIACLMDNLCVQYILHSVVDFLRIEAV